MASSHRPPARIALLAFLAAPLLLSLAACGGSKQNRPQLISSFPANEEMLPGLLAAVRLDYDEPVTVLNPEGVLIVADGVVIPSLAFQLEGDDDSVYVRPLTQTAFRPGALHNVRIFESLVVNGEQHYPLEEENVAFVIGGVPALAVGAPQVVRIFDRDTFQLIDSVPTPNAGTDAVVGLISTQSLAGRRYWAQRSNAGTGTDSFAYFDEGDAAMTEVPLTRSGMASELVSGAGCLAVGRLGEFIYIAYREEPEQQIRLSKVEIATAMEVDALVLSPTPGASTAPTGLTLSLNRDEIVVACSEGTSGRMVFVSVDTFTEIDRDPSTSGTQGVPMPHPPGELQDFVDRYITTALDGTGTVNAQQVLIGPYTTVQTPSLTTGTGVGSIVTLERALSIQTAIGYVNGEAVVTRSVFSGFNTAVPITISDDVGGVPTNTTSVIAAARYNFGDRFLMVHDGGILTRWLWNQVQFFQEDLDATTDGTQALDGGPDWADVTSIGRDFGQFPPP